MTGLLSERGELHPQNPPRENGAETVTPEAQEAASLAEKVACEAWCWTHGRASSPTPIRRCASLRGVSFDPIHGAFLCGVHQSGAAVLLSEAEARAHRSLVNSGYMIRRRRALREARA